MNTQYKAVNSRLYDAASFFWRWNLSAGKVVLLIFFSVIITSCAREDAEANAKGTPENPYTIIWYTIGTPQKDIKKVQNKINEYTREKIGAILDIRMIDWANYNEKMNVILISGENYDICFTSSWTNYYEKNALKGAFYPLNALLNEHGQGIIKAINPGFLEGAKINGELYAIPANKEIGQQLVYRINHPLLEKLGYSMSDFKSYEDLESLKSLEPFFQKIKENEPGYIPFAVFGNMVYILGDMDFLLSNSQFPGAVSIEEGNYKVFNQYEDPKFISYFNVHHDFYLKGYISADAAQIQDNQSLIVAGKWGADMAQYQPYADNIWSAAMNMTIKSFPAFKPIITNNSVEGSMMAISINSRRPDIVMKFLNLLNTDPYLRNLVQFGIEGIHYKKTAPNRIEFLKDHSNYDMPGFSLGNLFITYLLPGDPDDKWEQFDAWNKSAIPSQILGFHFDPKSVAVEIASITSVANQYARGLFTGQNDPKVYLPKLNSDLRKAGLEKLLKEQQRQLNEWVAKTKTKNTDQ